MSSLEFESQYRGRKVLVTGDTGFTGSWLCSWLNALGAQVSGLALPALRPDSLYEAAHVASICRHVDADIRDASRMSEIIAAEAPELVFHLAAQPLVRESYRDPAGTFATNVMGTVNVLNACRDVPSLRGIVVVTTDKVYRNNEWAWAYRESDVLGGKDPYSASKSACEIVISSFRDSFFSKAGVALAAARAGNIVGGGDWATDRIVPDMVRALVQRAPLVLRNPASTRPWQHVLAACHGYLLIGAGLMERPDVVGDAWNFGPSAADTRPVSEVVEAFARSWEPLRVVIEPSPLAEAGALMIDSQRARTVLGWRPAWDFDETLARTAGWYAGYYRDSAPAVDLVNADINAYRDVLRARG